MKLVLGIVSVLLLVPTVFTTVRATKLPRVEVRKLSDSSSVGTELSLYAVQYTTGPAWDTTQAPGNQQFLKDHSALMQKLRKDGTTILGGRYSDKGFLIMRAQSEEALMSILSADPSVQHGTMKFELHPFSPFYEGCVARK